MPEYNRNDVVLKLFSEWSETFKAKNHDYAASYILTGQTLQLWFPKGVALDSPLKQVFYGLLTRMLDKLIRASNLVLANKTEQVLDEKAYQTLGDLGAYSFMAAEVVMPNETASKQCQPL